ncbi:MAG TPA: hypothetical protein VHB25_14115 [Gemmatimonadaceae bacterium]|nr:hypothetical protein [Gemmatimonadaceae bacterium]
MLRPFLFLALLATIAASAFRPPQTRGRPLVLFVHGRGMQGRDTAALRAMWRDALDSGATGFTHGPLVQDRDVRLVWYADVLDEASGASCDYAPSDPRARRDAAEDDGLKSFVSLVGSVLDGFSAAASDSDARSTLRSLAADAVFLSDAHKRCAAEARLADALDRARAEARPVVVVAHSLGSIVAYDYLSALRDSGLVQTLVTVGSPLGSPDLRHLLIGGGDGDTLTALRAVGTWINVRNDGDPLATDVRPARDVEVQTPADEPDPHELVGYLREKETAAAVLGAWCGAFRADAPAACDRIPTPQ